MNYLKFVIIGVGILFANTASAGEDDTQVFPPIRGTFVGAHPDNTEAQGGGEFSSDFNLNDLWFDGSGNPGSRNDLLALTGGNSGSSTTGTGGYQPGAGDVGIVTTITGLTPGDSYVIDFIHTNSFGGSILPYSVGFTPENTSQVADTNVFGEWLAEEPNSRGVCVWDHEIGTTTADENGEIKVYVNLIPPPDAFYSGLLAYNGVSFSPDAATPLLGDVNLDGTVSFLDIAPFIAVLANGGFQAEADIDLDGLVTFLDIQPFIDILSGG